MKSLILLIAFASTCLALTPKERELVQGLTNINRDLRIQIATDEAAISQKDTDYLFLKQRNESLTLKHDALKKLAGDQEFELSLQQQKAKDQAAALDKQTLRADSAESKLAKKTAEAHRNAVERDICLFALSVAVTVLVMIYSGQIIGWITSKFPALTPYGIGLWLGLAILTFLSSFGASRGVLAMVASRL
jgi:DNA replication initiation complex subunit (GINS family)